MLMLHQNGIRAIRSYSTPPQRYINEVQLDDVIWRDGIARLHLRVDWLTHYLAALQSQSHFDRESYYDLDENSFADNPTDPLQADNIINQKFDSYLENDPEEIIKLAFDDYENPIMEESKSTSKITCEDHVFEDVVLIDFSCQETPEIFEDLVPFVIVEEVH